MSTANQKIGYRCNQDCMLDYTNFEQGEEIIIAEHCEDRDWKGTEWYDSFPQIFEPIYSDPALSKPLTEQEREDLITKIRKIWGG